MHGFASATAIHDVAQSDDWRPLIVLYIGDFDPSGLYMSEVDIPARLEKYGGHHVEIKRIALLREHVGGLLSFPAADKKRDCRYRWFAKNYGRKCWELDALDPNTLREIVKQAIVAEIDDEAWDRCSLIEKAERESLRTVLDAWKGAEP